MNLEEQARQRVATIHASGRIIWPNTDEWLIVGLLDLIDTHRADIAAAVAHDPGKVGPDHPETAKRAATLPVFGSQRWAVLDYLSRYQFTGCTAAEVADSDEFARMSRNQVAARLHELRHNGLVRYCKDADGNFVTRRTSKGASGRVQQITEYGLQLVRSGRNA